MYSRIRLAANKTLRASTDTSSLSHHNSLKEILRKNGPRLSVPSLLQQRVDSGHAVTLPELRSITNRLIKSNRHDLALQMMEWMETQKEVHFSADDTCLRLELIIKSHGLHKAAEYFEKLSVKLAKASYLPLLRGYVKSKLVQEGESLMEKLNGLGFLVTPHPFNEMMKLYEATRQYEKVVLVIPRNVLSYNLWMNACCEVNGVAGVESVYKEMVDDTSVEVGWSSLCTLANVYIKGGFVEKVLESAEKKLNRSNRLGATCANYICVLSSLVKLGDLAEAERVFSEWEETCFNYDVRVSNVLLGAYMRGGDIRRAEALHHRVLERGGAPNYKTWEILMEGFVKCQSMEKAIDAMHRAFEVMKHCHWRPSQKIVMAIAEYFEKEAKMDEANGYVRDLHRLGLASLPLYRLLLRMHEHVQRPASDIYEMMKLDKIIMDRES
ncbi:hypothetical protein F2Q68_00012147 [Brassica cretica]|uniref:Pentacotripeptide-repeat region of PRORP domain-containing protein n=1 Tax=Brassica cretica TaxID=69181 RepID=A0A8S9KX38_BRACR|nr:hypothetical protein F2Q68_00012147 [Brassica cretica]